MSWKESGVSASELRGAAVEEAFELVRGVVVGVNEAYSDLGTVERYRLIADLLPERIELDLQQRLLEVAQRGREERRRQAAYAFLMLNLKTVLTVTEGYFDGDPERDADIVAAGMKGLVEGLPNLNPRANQLSPYIHHAVDEGVVQYLDQFEGMRPTLVRLGVSGEVKEAVDRLVRESPWGVDRERRKKLASRLAKGFSPPEGFTGEEAAREYIDERVAALPDVEGEIADSENEALQFLMREDVRAAMTSLPEKEQEVLRLRYWEGLTLEGVGERMGLTRDKVRGVEAMALRHLRNPMKFGGLRKWWRE